MTRYNYSNKKRLSPEVARTIIGLVIFVAVVGFVMIVEGSMQYFQCHAQWPDNKPSWGFIQGCLVEHDGKMVPTSSIRNF